MREAAQTAKEDPCWLEKRTVPDVHELVNLQNVKGQAKPYQVRQCLKLVERYNLRLED